MVSLLNVFTACLWVMEDPTIGMAAEATVQAASDSASVVNSPLTYT